MFGSTKEETWMETFFNALKMLARGLQKDMDCRTTGPKEGLSPIERFGLKAKFGVNCFLRKCINIANWEIGRSMCFCNPG